MKIFSKITQYFLVLSLSLAVFFGGVTTALANTPTYSATTINGNQIQLYINGDANSTINLYYYQNNNYGSAISAGNIGTTNGSGYFSAIISSNTYSIPSGATTYVIVNGQQSPQMIWPYYTGGSYNNGGVLTLSQTSVTVGIGQGTSISVYGGSNNYVVSSNSNPNVVSSIISNNLLGIYGTASGQATLSICSPNSGAPCVNVFVTVSGNYYGGNNNYNNGVNNCFNGSYYYTCNTNYNSNGSFNNNYNYNNGYNGNYYGNGGGFTPINGNGVYNGSYYNYNNGYNGTPVVYTTTYTQPVYTPVVSNSSYGTPVSGVYLSQVPSTGVTWNLKTILFTLGLLLWSALVAHLVIERKKIRAMF